MLPYLAESLEPVEPPAWLRESVIAAAKADLAAALAASASRTERRVARSRRRAGRRLAPSRAPGRHHGRSSRSQRPASRAAAGHDLGDARVAAAVAIVVLAGYGVVVQGDPNEAAQVARTRRDSTSYGLTQNDTQGRPCSSPADGSRRQRHRRAHAHRAHLVRCTASTPTKGDQVYVVWLTSGRRRPDQGRLCSRWTTTGDGYLEVDNVPTAASLWVFVCQEPNASVTHADGPDGRQRHGLSDSGSRRGSRSPCQPERSSDGV